MFDKHNPKAVSWLWTLAFVTSELRAWGERSHTPRVVFQSWKIALCASYVNSLRLPVKKRNHSLTANQFGFWLSDLSHQSWGEPDPQTLQLGLFWDRWLTTKLPKRRTFAGYQGLELRTLRQGCSLFLWKWKALWIKFLSKPVKIAKMPHVPKWFYPI